MASLWRCYLLNSAFILSYTNQQRDIYSYQIRKGIGSIFLPLQKFIPKYNRLPSQ